MNKAIQSIQDEYDTALAMYRQIAARDPQRNRVSEQRHYWDGKVTAFAAALRYLEKAERGQA